MVFFRIEEAVRLHYLGMCQDKLCHFPLQGGPGAVSGSDRVNAHRHHNAVAGVHQLLDLAGERVDFIGPQGIVHTHMQRAHHNIRAIIVQDKVKDAVYLRNCHYLLPDGAGELRRHAGAKKFTDRLADHLHAGFEDDYGDESAENSVQGDMPDEHDAGRQEGGGGDDGIKEGIGARGDERIAAEFFSLFLDIAAQHQFHHDGYADDDEGREAVGGFRGMDDLADGLVQRRGAGREHDDGDDDGAEVLDAAMPVGVVAVGGFEREFGPDDGDDAGKDVGEVVHGVQDNGHGTGEEAYKGLESRQHQVGDDSHHAGSDNLGTSVHGSGA